MKHKWGYGFAAWLVQERFQVGVWGLPPLRKKMANPVGGVAPGRAKAREPCFLLSAAPCQADVVTIEKENNPQNIPHEEVFRGCTIIGIFFDSCIA